jgi:hydrogenase expression/formation protein HypE
MVIDEVQIPVKGQVAAACELLGLDPLYMANEGKLVAICPPEQCAALLMAMQQHPLGRNAARIGEVVADPQQRLVMQTRLGGNRLVDWLSADPLPRIC